MPLTIIKAMNPPDFDRLSELFKLMSDPSRLHILWCICQAECSVGQICEMTGLSQANVSKHLQMLRMGGIVACRKEGNSRIYFLADPKYLGLCAQSLIELSNINTSREEISSCED
ncbi:MAG: ArsR family transcriptional regulator [Cyanobacteria bacterium M5B4]|nr:MAG: ArsR family transcriptional regulator [Cyanobacteria bacterium M5B4]